LSMLWMRTPQLRMHLAPWSCKCIQSPRARQSNTASQR